MLKNLTMSLTPLIPTRKMIFAKTFAPVGFVAYRTFITIFFRDSIIAPIVRSVSASTILSYMFPLSDNFKVLYLIVKFISVYMMNYFFSGEISTNMLLHKITMIKHSFTSDTYPKISIFSQVRCRFFNRIPTFPLIPRSHPFFETGLVSVC